VPHAHAQQHLQQQQLIALVVPVLANNIEQFLTLLRQQAVFRIQNDFLLEVQPLYLITNPCQT
jgi:hypothetical protein